MSLPACFSVSKSRVLVKDVSDYIRHISVAEWNHAKKAPWYQKPYLRVWVWMKQCWRFTLLFGCYVVLFLAWITRVAAITAVCAVIATIVAAFAGVFTSSTSSNYSTAHLSPPAGPPSSPPSSSGYPYTPSNSSLRTENYTPRISPEDASKLGNGVYEYALRDKMVNVNGYYRGNTYVAPYTRQPPGGLQFEDKTQAAGAAIGVTALLYGIDYAGQQYDQWKVKRDADANAKAQEQARLQVQAQSRAEQDAKDRLFRLFRESDQNKQQQSKPWWKW